MNAQVTLVRTVSLDELLPVCEICVTWKKEKDEGFFRLIESFKLPDDLGSLPGLSSEDECEV